LEDFKATKFNDKKYTVIEEELTRAYNLIKQRSSRTKYETLVPTVKNLLVIATTVANRIAKGN